MGNAIIDKMINDAPARGKPTSVLHLSTGNLHWKPIHPHVLLIFEARKRSSDSHEETNAQRLAKEDKER